MALRFSPLSCPATVGEMRLARMLADMLVATMGVTSHCAWFKRSISATVYRFTRPLSDLLLNKFRLAHEQFPIAVR
jgi:hypothetical protein